MASKLTSSAAHRKISAKRLRFHVLCFVTLLLLLCLQSAESQHGDDADAATQESPADIRRRHAASKAWYLKKIQVTDSIQLPISPFSLIILFFSFSYLYFNWSGDSGATKQKVYCEASHILIMDHSKATKEKLTQFQQTIQSDPALFAKHAKKHSACPSKGVGGSLGKFSPGTMAPPFDKVCFDPSTPLQTAVGPVQTNFGWHLIYIHERQLPE